MPVQIIDGKAIANKLKLQIRQQVDQLKARGFNRGWPRSGRRQSGLGDLREK
jgi:hypothetical protein